MSINIIKYLGLTLLFLQFAANASIHPQRELTPLFFLNSALKNGEVDAPDYKVSRSSKVNWYGKRKITLTNKQYSNFQYLSRGVFQVFINKGGRHFGSAFLVKDNILMTNLHVIEEDGDRTCHGVSFQTKVNGKQMRVHCSEVLYCHNYKDFCFVKTSSINYKNKTYKLSELIIPYEFSQEIKADASFLRLMSDNRYSSNEYQTRSINNSRGIGLQGSSGKGLMLEKVTKYKKNCERIKKPKRKARCLKKRQDSTFMNIVQFASVFPGASGSPLFNESGKVIGLTRAMSKIEYGHKAQNYATPINEIIEQLKFDNENDLVQLLL
jgi:hypothetical protein